MKMDRANGVIRFNCIIMDRGAIPNYAGLFGPILKPRLFELKDVILFVKMGVDIRVVDGNDINNAQRLTLQNLEQMVNNFNNPRRVVKQQPKQEVKQEQPKQEVKQEQPKQEVKQEQPKENNKKQKK